MDLSAEEELDYSDGEIENSQEQHGEDAVGLVKHGTKEGQDDILTQTDSKNGNKVMDSMKNSIFKETADTTTVEHVFTEGIALGVVDQQQQDFAILEADLVVLNNDHFLSSKEPATRTTLTLSKEATPTSSCPTVHKNDASSISKLNNCGQRVGKKMISMSSAQDFHNNQCYFCQKTFKTMVDLRYHIGDHTQEKIYKCFCHKAFINREEATLHLNVHMAAIEGGLNFLQRKVQVELPLLLADDNNDQENEEASSSSKSLCGKKDLGPCTRPRPAPPLHSKRIRGQYHCKKCEKCYTNKGNLLRHEETIHSGIKFKCSKCDKSFNNKENLHRHKNTVHSNLRKFKCLECGKSFKLKRTLTVHKNTVHSNSRKFKCSDCGKSFKLKRTLTQHTNGVHLNLREFKCLELECGKSFHQKANLIRHKNTVHSNRQIRQVQCPQCQRFYSSRTTLKTHIDSDHDGHVRYPCSQCTRTFASKGNASRHEKDLHPE